MQEKSVTREQLIGSTVVSGIGAVLALLLLLAYAALMPQYALLQNHLSTAGEGIIMLCALIAGWTEKRRFQTSRPAAAAVTAVIMTAVILFSGAVWGCKCCVAAVIVNLIAEFVVSFAGTFFAGKGRKKPHGTRYYRK